MQRRSIADKRSQDVGMSGRRGTAHPASGRALPAAVTIAVLSLGACGTVGGPAAFRFVSNLAPPEARRCLATTLTRNGFTLDPPAADSSLLVGYRRLPGRLGSTQDWWRMEVSAGGLSDGSTAIDAVASAGPTRDGPFGGPPPELEGVVGTLSASCTWTAGPG